MATTETSSGRETEQAVRDLFHAVFVERDFSDPGRFWTDDSLDHFLPQGIDVRGKTDLKRYFEDLFRSLPDWSLEIEQVTAEGRRAVVQWTGRGTFTGAPWQGMDATGGRIELRGVDVIVLDEDGRLVENTVYYDGMEYLRAAGLMPPRDSAGERAMLAAGNAVTRLKRRLRNR